MPTIHEKLNVSDEKLLEITKVYDKYPGLHLAETLDEAGLKDMLNIEGFSATIDDVLEINNLKPYVYYYHSVRSWRDDLTDIVERYARRNLPKEQIAKKAIENYKVAVLRKLKKDGVLIGKALFNIFPITEKDIIDGVRRNVWMHEQNGSLYHRLATLFLDAADVRQVEINAVTAALNNVIEDRRVIKKAMRLKNLYNISDSEIKPFILQRVLRDRLTECRWHERYTTIIDVKTAFNITNEDLRETAVEVVCEDLVEQPWWNKKLGNYEFYRDFEEAFGMQDVYIEGVRRAYNLCLKTNPSAAITIARNHKFLQRNYQKKK